MLRLTWLQFRLQAAVAVVALVALAALLVVTGVHLAHLYDSTIVPCAAQGDCDPATGAFLRQERVLRTLLEIFLLIMPALIGIFWGTPLVARELETGTFRLAWTQSVSRSRWLVAKLGVITVASMAVAGLLSLLATWWFSPVDKVTANRFASPHFDARDVVPIGYAALAVALGIAAGVVLRRTLPAMAVTLVAFLGLRLALIFWVRPHLMAPAHTSLSLTALGGKAGFAPSSAGVTFVPDPPQFPNAWTLSSHVVDQQGRVATAQVLHQFLQTACPVIANLPGPGSGDRAPADRAVFDDCITQLSASFHLAVTYQPAGRYWTFQWVELMLYLGLAGVLAAFTFWWLRRRLA